MQYQAKSLKKPSGGRRVRHHKKKKREIGTLPSMTNIDDRRKRKLRVRGGNQKIKLFSENTANVMDPKTKKVKKVKILEVVENKAHHQFAKLKIMTKGAIIKTEAGEARITSRPGQIGVIDAVLLEKKK
jgi:small subunit ribosomal protein S8e